MKRAVVSGTRNAACWTRSETQARSQAYALIARRNEVDATGEIESSQACWSSWSSLHRRAEMNGEVLVLKASPHCHTAMETSRRPFHAALGRQPSSRRFVLIEPKQITLEKSIPFHSTSGLIDGSRVTASKLAQNCDTPSCSPNTSGFCIYALFLQALVVFEVMHYSPSSSRFCIYALSSKH